jgi:hypothetical protein
MKVAPIGSCRGVSGGRKVEGDAVTVTEKSAFRCLQAGHVNVNDVLADLELESIARERLTQDVNGSLGERIQCDCAECKLHGRPVPLHREGDCAYAVARSRLVDEAVFLAVIRSNSDGDWNAVFAGAMEELARPLLNPVSGVQAKVAA